MLKEKIPNGGSWFYHYEPPYLPGEKLVFPNDPGGTVGIEKVGSGKVVPWRGRAGDTVLAPAGTEFRPIPLPEQWQGLKDYVFTLGEDGWLTPRLEPAEP
ncbi:MAG TPA: hypothetical protein VNN17_05765 [Terriglobia bacterium]|nr:hypothetical protein [Terriglobia bacterium]